MKVKRKILNPRAAFALTRDGKLAYFETRPPTLDATHVWPYHLVSKSPATFMKFLLDAKARGATPAALRLHADAVNLPSFITDAKEVLECQP